MTSEVKGTYALSILLQELALARNVGLSQLVLDSSVLRENPVDRLSHLIRDRFWAGLRRSVDKQGRSHSRGRC